MAAARTRRRRDSSRPADPFAQRRRRYEATLRPMGLWEPFSRMPRHVQQLFWKRKMPDPVLLFDASVPNGRPEHRAMRRAVEAGFRRASLEIEGRTLSVRDFIAVISSCTLVVRHSEKQGMPPDVAAFLEQAEPVLEKCFKEQMTPAMGALYHGVHTPMAAHSRLDTRLLTARLEYEPTASGKREVQVIVSAWEPQVRQVTLDGGTRPMYRAAEMPSGKEVNWISWDSALVQRGRGGQKLPVYVQSHALRQLDRRVNFPPAAPYLQAWLGESLSDPRIIRRQGQDLLVEYRINDHRLGYLVTTPLEEMVVVRTFKFLTMEGTPEARLLQKRLRLSRRDVDWLGLCELSAFTHTDLSADAELRALVESCGCGHLFELGDDDWAPQPKAFAAELRRYLRMAA